MTNFQINIGADEGPVFVPARYLNRHGLIAGATGTGKSVSAIGLAEALSRIGVPSFVTDIKGDLSGIGAPSTGNGAAIFPGWRAEASPLRLLDVFGKTGAPFTTTIRAMGSPLVARALSLSEVQAGVLDVAFAVAEDNGQPLDTLADLRAVVNHCASDEHREDVSARYGLVTPSSVAAIGRAILRLDRAGGASFFSRKPLDPAALMQVDPLGRGVVSMLDCVELVRQPRLYAAVLLALLDSLSASLPEVGDTDKPKLALILDEAHLIFDECPPELLRMVDQTVRLIRSKGVGVFFATQSPSDIPDAISRQLHLRIQHALRCVTPGDAKNVIAAAQSMPAPVGFRAADVIGSLEKGRALVSFMDENGKLTAARVVSMALPRCRLSPLTESERAALLADDVRNVGEQRRRDTEAAYLAERNSREPQGTRPALSDEQKSDRRHGRAYLAVAAVGAVACFPWVSMVSPVAALLPPLAMAALYPLPLLASLGVIAGMAQGRVNHAQRHPPRRR